MVNRPFRESILYLAIVIFAVSNLAIASDNVTRGTQGKVTRVNFEKKVLVVYETDFFWNENTVFCDKNGTSIAVNQLKPNAWVDILWENGTGAQKRIAKKVYLLSRPVNKGD